ncbi:hypothetical protein ACFL2H_05995 [Planctomycetota bacterium]
MSDSKTKSQVLTTALVISLMLHAAALAADVMESFNGEGDFTDVSGRVEGLDEPDWTIEFDDPSGARELVNGGYPLSLAISKNHYDALGMRDIEWSGGFVQRLEIRDLNLFTFPDDFNGVSYVSHEHSILGQSKLEFAVTYSVARGRPVFVVSDGVKSVYESQVGENIALEIVFHESLSLVEWRIDNDIDDGSPAIELGTNLFQFSESPRKIAIQSEIANSGIVNASIDHFSLSPLLPGDFNYDESFDTFDLAILANDLGSSEPRRDLNKDSVVDSKDRDHWVHDIAKTYYGDANLDGEFNTADLVSIFNAAQYEDDIVGNSTWETGDWNLDGDFTTADLVLAFQDGGYEKGPVAVVPEPAFSLLPLLLLLWRCRVRQAGVLHRTEW